MGFGLLGKEQIIERWDTLISGSDGQGETVMEDTKRFLKQSEAPDVKTVRQHISPGIIQGLLGGKRPFIVVSNTSNPNLKPFRMYINTRDYGVNLQVSWFLVYQPALGERCLNFFLKIPVLSLLIFPAYFLSKVAASRESGILDLNIFDEQDLRAYVTNAHQCLTNAVERLTREQTVDTSMIKKHSKGFLGIV
jgi:hypothetical protein